MIDRRAVRAARDSALIAALLGIPAGLLSDSISEALSSRKADWLYVLTVILFIALLVLIRVLFSIRSAGRSSGTPVSAIGKVKPADRVSLSDVILTAREEVVFFGVSGKRTVTEDGFRRSLEKLENRNLRIRFLLLDPSCDAFGQRARDEGESAEAWRADMQTTISRLASHKNSSNLDIRLRFSSAYPVWRAIIVDREQVHVSVFLPGRRGTEADQYSMKKSEEQIAHAVIKSYQLAWKQAQEVTL